MSTISKHPDEILKFRIALCLLTGIGPVLARNLVSYCGGVEEIFRRKKSQLEKIPGIGPERADLIAKHDNFERAEAEVKFIRRHQIQTFFYLDENYPMRLKNCDDAPALLFFKGQADLNAPRMLAIVGTRHMTSYGRDLTDTLIKELEPYKPTIVSGLAYGVDIQAHKAAVKAGLPTIGVTAHGLDRIYPAEHKPTAEKMVKHGGILTEYPAKTKPDRENFPARNRIVAGICDATIVVESAVKGGALITAELANDYNRDVFAMPGKIGSEYSQGCHQLIRLNKAMLIESAEQIAQALSWDVEDERAKKKKPEKQLHLFHSFNDEEKTLVNILQKSGRIEIDLLAIEAEMPVSRVSTLLLNLEFAGVLKSLPGKVYELV